MRKLLLIFSALCTLSSAAQSVEGRLLRDYPGAKIVSIKKDTVYSPFRKLWELAIFAENAHSIFAKELEKIDLDSQMANIYLNAVLEVSEHLHDSIALEYDVLRAQKNELQRQDYIDIAKHHEQSVVEFQFAGETYEQTYFQEIGKRQNIHTAAELDNAHNGAVKAISSFGGSLIAIRDAYEDRIRSQLKNLKKK